MGARSIDIVVSSKEKKLKTYLQIVNSIFALTDSELKVLEEFIEIDSEVACSTEARKLVNVKLNFNSIAIVNNHVKALKDKGAIIPQDKRKYSYHSILKYNSDIDKVTINLK